jgi:hypothetical protein
MSETLETEIPTDFPIQGLDILPGMDHPNLIYKKGEILSEFMSETVDTSNGIYHMGTNFTDAIKKVKNPTYVSNPFLLKDSPRIATCEL